jgi:uroporphyrinogen-III synthase
MKILFTKTSIRENVSKKIGEKFSCDFVEVIRIKNDKVRPFNIKGQSLIFSSVNGVKSFFENGFKPNENLMNADSYNKIYAVGLMTKKELRKNGFGTFKVTRRASELSDFIIENNADEKFLHFCGNLSLNILDKTLPLQNIGYKKIPMYETELLYPKIEEKYDAVCFFSPSGVRSFGKFNTFDGFKIFSIGETTEKELRKLTKNKIFTSKESTLDDLILLVKYKMC